MLKWADNVVEQSTTTTTGAYRLDSATIITTRSADAETFHLKTASGDDPSASDPVRVAFANATGGFDVLEVTAPTSLLTENVKLIVD